MKTILLVLILIINLLLCYCQVPEEQAKDVVVPAEKVQAKMDVEARAKLIGKLFLPKGSRNGPSISMQKDQAVKASPSGSSQPSSNIIEVSHQQARRQDINDNKALSQACVLDVKRLCPNVPLGADRVRHCLQDHKHDSVIDKGCQQEIIFDEISRAASFNSIRMDLCAKTAATVCADVLPKSKSEIDYLFGTVEKSQISIQNDRKTLKAKSLVVRCLIENFDQLDGIARDVGEPDCRDEVFRDVREKAEDIRFAPEINAACEDDMARFCSNLAPGGGRVHKCLQMHLEDLSSKCQYAEFEETMLESNDERLKASVMKACKGELQLFCDGATGSADRLECLQDHRQHVTISENCRSEINNDLEVEAKSIVFHPKLRYKCGKQIGELCSDEELLKLDPKTGQRLYGHDNPTMYCLIAKAKEIHDAACHREVRRVERQQAASVKFDLRTMHQCHDDIRKFCDDVKDTDGSVHECLQSHVHELSTSCRRSELASVKMLAEDPSVNVHLLTSCANELKNLCGVRDSKNTLSKQLESDMAMKCLLEGINSESMGTKCQTNLIKFQKLTRKDVELRPIITRTCSKDMGRLCTKRENGEIISCLRDNVKKILNSDCKELIDGEIMQEARSIDLDPEMLNACSTDLENFCAALKDPKTGSYGVDGEAEHCLREHHWELSKTCLQQQRKAIARESTSIKFKPTLLRACRKEMREFCPLFNYKSAEGLMCLREHRDDHGMGARCHDELVFDETNINADLRNDMIFMAKCENVLRKLCPDVLNIAHTPAEAATREIESCIRENQEDLTKMQSGKARLCADAVEGKLRDQASDIRLDPSLNAACHTDQLSLCADIEAGEGRIKVCLRDHFSDLSEECQQAEFQSEIDSADDILQQPQIRHSCNNEIRDVCHDAAVVGGTIQNGEGSASESVLECLKSAALDRNPMIGARCQASLRSLMKASSRNVELNRQLFRSCKFTFSEICPKIVGVVEVVAEALTDAKSEALMECMFDHRSAVNEPECKDALSRELIRRAADYELDPSIHRHCARDVLFYCSDTKSENVHSCLQKNIDGLDPKCKALEEKEQIRQAADIRLKPTLVKACSADIAKFCVSANDAESPGATLMCLENHVNRVEFSSECRALVHDEEKQEAENVALNAPIMVACSRALKKFCTSRNGEVVQNGIDCLIEHREEKSIGGKCRALLIRQAVKLAEDITLDSEINAACFYDQRQFCTGVEPGEGRIYTCLEEHLHELSTACTRAEFKVLKRRQEDIRFNFPESKWCAKEIEKFCAEESKEASGRKVIPCLEVHSSEQDFSAACAKQVTRNARLASRNVELRPVLAESCRDDIKQLCSKVKTVSDGAVIQCLVDNLDKIKSADCRSNTFEQAKLQSSDINAAAKEISACMNDVEMFCPNFVRKGKRQSESASELKLGVRQCLWEHRSKLSLECQKSEFNEIQREAKDLQLANGGRLAKACANEFANLCQDISLTDSATLSCLVLQRTEPNVEISKACDKAIDRYQRLTLGDPRLIPEFWGNCESSVRSKCGTKKNERLKSVLASLPQGSDTDAFQVSMTQADANEMYQCLLQQKGWLRKNNAKCLVSVMFVGTQTDAVMQVSSEFEEKCGAESKRLCSLKTSYHARVDCLVENQDDLDKSCTKLLRKWNALNVNSDKKDTKKNVKTLVKEFDRKKNKKPLIGGSRTKQAKEGRTKRLVDDFRLSGWIALVAILSLASGILICTAISIYWFLLRCTSCCENRSGSSSRKAIRYTAV